LVGVTTYRQQAAWGPWDRLAEVLPASYAECVADAGGRPVLLPPCDGPGAGDDSAPGVVDALDALVLVGGGDLDPARYGQAPHAATGAIDPGRDANELALLDAALRQDVPVLAICRGMQVLNVLLEGTLVQHLPDVVGHLGHQPDRGCFGPTEVTTEPGSILAKVVGESGTVSCSHHQAVDRVGTGLSVVARASDGTVEALELPSRRFVVGVQWHPEEDRDLRLFEALVGAI
jgi:gamma-glutamyl-gamma-aminobutyrate hydrolase PuuD